MELDEAVGMVLDVRRGTRHWHVTGNLGEVRRRVCVVALGGGKSDANSRRRLNYLTGARRAPVTLREAAKAAGVAWTPASPGDGRSGTSRL